MEDEVQLKVDKAYPIDLGRGVIRVDPKALLKLNLSTNEIVEIWGKKKTTSIVCRLDRQDWEQGIVRIDNFVRQSAGVSIGEKVRIKKAKAVKAKKLILALPESMTQSGPELQFGEHSNENIKRHILKRPVFKGDIIPIIDLTPQSIIEPLTTSKVISFVAVETDPANVIVQVTEETTIKLLYKAAKTPEDEEKLVFTSSIEKVNKILKPLDLAIMKNENTEEITLRETKDTFISASKNIQKKIVFTPSVFEIPKKSNVSNCVSVMIPFSTEFDDVYGCINDACYEIGMACHKADDFWHHSAIIQDIFELIFRSSIVVVDFTNKNPNVFYEAGIAHALGKTVIPITQNSEDIPFDLRHHRYLLYRNDKEGLKKLKRELVSKLNFEKNRE